MRSLWHPLAQRRVDRDNPARSVSDPDVSGKPEGHGMPSLIRGGYDDRKVRIRSVTASGASSCGK